MTSVVPLWEQYQTSLKIHTYYKHNYLLLISYPFLIIPKNKCKFPCIFKFKMGKNF